MIFFFGQRLYGRVFARDGTAIVTRFFHIWFMPIVPLSSHLQAGAHGYRPTRLVLASVVAGYLRTWPFVIALAAFPALLRFTATGRIGASLVAAPIVAAGALFAGFRVVGRLSSEEVAQRRVYAAVLGQPFDITLLPIAEALEYPRVLRERVVSDARGLMGGTYRTALDPVTQWDAVALDPTVTDASFLQRALTLARAEATVGEVAERARFAASHASIWERVRAAAPAASNATSS